MTLRERAGQLVMVGVTTASAAEVKVLKDQKIGSVILMGQHTDGVAGVRKVVARLSWKGRSVPLLVAVDQEGGVVQRLRGKGFDTIPSARVQATWKDSTLQSSAGRWGRQLAAAGVTWTLAPVADVVPADMTSRNAPIGALRRGYGSKPAAVAAKEGNDLVQIGYAYVTMGQADKGIPLIEQAIAKGGLKRPEDAKLRLGLALLQSGAKNKSKAVQTLRSVQGADGAADLGRLWALYAGTQG